jgi:P27 family predicted phage terminase small subunit
LFVPELRLRVAVRSYDTRASNLRHVRRTGSVAPSQRNVLRVLREGRWAVTKRSSPDKKKLRGNPSGKKQFPQLSAAGDVWNAPRHLKAKERAQWNTVVAAAPNGLLATIDRDLLEMYCVHMCAHREAVAALHKEGLVVELTNGTPMTNPHLIAAGKQADLVMKLAKLLGLPPLSRVALGAIAAFDGRIIEGSLVAFKDQRPTFDA